ncbi:MAG TPA: xanthine dehydrogenase family protein molybdopterin-binding subunit [Acidimicrobiales bacterium]|nr:xanthine dehydrogenase family protein molybdopterin-binding subunit [Acidimicrobiales bacterium]
MPGSILGNRVRRVEDPELLTGAGRYVADVAVDGLAHLAFVRSPFAHARIGGVDVSAARAAPGVIDVLRAEDLGLAPMFPFMTLNERAGRPPLAVDKVRFAGDMVAAVIADTPAAAADAAELVVVDYEPLPAVVDAEAALAPGAPLQFEELGSNVAAGRGDTGQDDPLAGAARVVRVRVHNQRVAVVPMEPQAITVVPGDDGDGHELTVWVATQMPHGLHEDLSELLGMEAARVRVIAPHVGGAFGAKAGVGPEHLVVAAAARRLGRPVAWTETRSENLVATPHGRGQVDYVEMGFDGDGHITGLRCRVVADAGAYAGFGGALAIGPTRMMAQGVYRIPKLRYEVVSALTNTTPMGAFRGAGRPEAAAFLERTMDVAAAELGIDPVELRRRNLIAPDAFPFRTLTGIEYDSGDYARALDEAVRRSGYDELRAEQARRRERGDRMLLGIGVAVYVEITGGSGSEYGSVEITEDGGAVIRVGTSSHGQGHATSFAMIVADRLGLPLEAVRFLQSDTAAVPRGGGTGGSRSLQFGGNAVAAAAEGVLDQARKLAADRLEANPADIVITDDGRLAVAGVPARAVAWDELAAAARADGAALAQAVDFSQPGPTFPFGAHIAVVEVDRETGRVWPRRHVAVDDCGRILNPLIVNGQQHGGIAQGMAQALWEEMVYDEDGNPVTATFADYGIPTSAELPSFETFNTETPTPRNPLGAKGIGESGTIGSTPAVHNAVVDALAHLGVRHVDMPCTPERVWRAITAAEAGSPPPAWRPPPDVFDGLPTGRDPEAAGADI